MGVTIKGHSLNQVDTWSVLHILKIVDQFAVSGATPADSDAEKSQRLRFRDLLSIHT